MSLPPVEIPLGAMRFNSDSQKLEYWNGDIWMQVHTFSPNLDGGARGFRAGAQTGGGSPWPQTDRIDYITISSAGNAIDFGNLTGNRFGPAGASSRTRGLFMCGGTPTRLANIDYFTMSSLGNAADFGDMTLGRAAGGNSAHSNQTRAMLSGGSSASSDYNNVMDFVTIASTGDGLDFGDLTAALSSPATGGSSTRSIMGGGSVPGGHTSVIEYVNIATTGNAQDVGDLVTASNGRAISNTIRLIISAHQTASTRLDTVIISTLGNAYAFSDLATAQTQGVWCTSSKTRGIWGIQPAGGDSNTIEYLSMTTSGTAVDFGDSTQVIRNCGGTSNDHGGLR